MRKSTIGMTICLGVIVSTISIAPTQAAVAPDAFVTASRPLPGCQNSSPNVGAVTKLTMSMSDESVELSWGPPQTRRGWSVTGYNVYKENRASGVLELFRYTDDASTSIDLAEFESDESGPVAIQVAAIGSNPKVSGGDEEGCRTGQVINGRAKVESGQTVTKSSWQRLECRTLGNQMMFVVAGWFKANAQVVAPGAFSLAIVLSPARVQAGPVLGWTFQQFKDAVGVWSSEALEPGYEFAVTSMKCFRG